MNWSLKSFGKTCLLFFLELYLHCGEARVNTEAPAGPLYRVVGSLLSISCNTSGFSNEHTDKEFEFRIKMPANPIEINIISTHDSSFSYAMYLSRVRNQEITLTRVTPNSAVFKVQSLQKSDEGEFECSVQNPETVYDGTYNAKTTVKVIDDSLTVSSPGPAELSYDEGDALTLTCRASSNTVQHTHLSLTWYLQKSGEDNPRPIISLDRDLTLIPGQGFEGRYQDGLIRLDKVGEGTYKLKFAKLEQSDQGEIYCQAQEWIQDPDRSWYSIAQKEAERMTLGVKAREALPAMSSLVVRMSAQPRVLQEGQELSLSCSLDTQNLEEKFFTVAWFRGSVELARIGPSGILSVGSEYSARADSGELQAARKAARDYSLVLQPVRTEDQGEYMCRAWPQVRGQDGRFTQETAHDSDPDYIKISASDGVFSLEMQNLVTVKEGDSLSLTCKVNGGQGQLSVTWQHKATSGATFTTVISQNQDGVTEKGPEFASRHFRAARPTTDTFALELDKVMPSDAGVYLCVVSAWKTNSKTISQSTASTVTVAPTGSFLKLRLIGRNNRVMMGESVELICQVKDVNVPISLSWTLQQADSSLGTIVTVYSDGSISWSGVQHRYQLKVERKKNEVLHYLLINGASHKEAGSYQCSVSVFLNEVYHKMPPSNQVAVTVENPVSKLELTSAPTLTGNINTNIEIKCSVLQATSPSSRYSVTWQLQQEDKNKTLISSDQDALVTFEPQLDLISRQRISIMRFKGPAFDLLIRHAQMSDAGSYICEVVEWLQDAQNHWYPLPPKSKTIKLTLTEPVSKLKLTSAPTLTGNINTNIEIKCSVLQATSPSSRYSVTWQLQQEDKNKTLISSDRDALVTFEPQLDLISRQRISIMRSKGPAFDLLIRHAQMSDAGSYICEVVEWLQDAQNHWYPLPPKSKTIKLTLTEPENDLHVNLKEQSQSGTEGSDVTLQCDIVSGTSSPLHFYNVSWLYAGSNLSSMDVLVQLDHTGLLSYSQHPGLHDLQQRLHLSRPTQMSSYLRIQNAQEEGGGTYKCQIELFQLDREGQWQKKASESSSPITLTGNASENNLVVVQKDAEVNVSTSQEFTILCHITQQSSKKSEFQVMWFYQEELTGNRSRLIFASYLNSTLQAFERSDQLRFNCPLHKNYSLTVSKLALADTGMYFCKVEEWLPDPSHDWRKVATKMSGYLTVHVFSPGDTKATSQCNTVTWIIITLAIVTCLLSVIFVLILKMRQSKTGKKTEKCLWTEQVSLNTKPCLEE